MARVVKTANPSTSQKNRPARHDPAPAVAQPHAVPGTLVAAFLFAAALVAAFAAYAPSLNGDFVFDDRGLPIFYPDAATLPLRFWLGVRPMLMATYYFNFHTSGLDTGPYHALNVFFHAANAVLVFFAIRRLLDWVRTDCKVRSGIALFGAALFLLHPIQTEAVSYIASRSETLSVLFFLAAFNVFLHRRRVEIAFVNSAIILVLYVCAMSCKEHTAMLPAALLLTDYFFNPGFAFTGIRRNWRLYLPVGLAGAAGLFYFASYITAGSNLGFGMKDLPWYAYLFTQFRALFVYFRLFVLPINQSVDHTFPISHNLLDHGALIYGFALILIVGAAFRYRRRFPLASYGFFLALTLFAPTSSLLPIRDPLVERRLYLPFIGLALVACAFALRLPWTRRAMFATLTAICLLFGGLTFARNRAWVDMESLWKDAVDKQPDNTRALMGLADSYALRHHCAEAIPYFERASKLDPHDYRTTYNLASAYDCVNRNEEADAVYRKTIAIASTAEVWTHLAMVQMKRSRFDQAFASLANAEHADRNYLLAYTYSGILDLYNSHFEGARANFQFVLDRNPTDEYALRGLDRALKHERQF